MTQTDIAQALHRVSDLMRSGLPLAAVYVQADHGITVVASPLAAARWRERCGQSIGGHPLHVVSAAPVAATPLTDRLRAKGAAS